MNNPAILQSLLDPQTLTGAVFFAVLFFVLALIASMLVKRLLRRFMDRKLSTSVDRTASTFMLQLLQVTIFFVTAIFYFSLIPPLRAIGTAILATAGVASIVLGLAAQSTLGNIISGLSILLYRPVRLGDRVKIYASAGDETGIVASITLGYTTLTMQEGDKVIVPNSVLASTVIVNYGRSEDPHPPLSE